MFNRIIWPLLIAAVLYLAYAAFKGTAERLIDVQNQGPSIEEQILSDLDFFYEEFSQRQLMRLKAAEKENLVSVDRVDEPDPGLARLLRGTGSPTGLRKQS